MSPVGAKLKRAAILIHRWMGVAFCILFATWFASGIGMMYWDYPGVGAAERLAHAPTLDASKIHIPPAQAYAAIETSQTPTDTRIGMFDGRPVYRFRIRRVMYSVYADDGQTITEITPELTRRVAAAWTGQPANTAKFEGSLEEDDQWTLSEGLHFLRPFSKYSWPDGRQVYVSEVTGEVVQDTTPGSRMGAYFSAIPHWLYFPWLRKDGESWTSVIVWSSGIGTIASLFGLLVGLLIYSPSKRYRYEERPSSIPYRGQQRWHTILGLIFGLFTCTWVFSGMLSMEPFDWLSGNRGPRIGGALRGGPLKMADFADKLPQAAVVQGSVHLNIKELELTSFAGEAVYLATDAPHHSFVIPVHGDPSPEFDRARIMDIVTAASAPYAPAEVRTVTEYEAYYLDRHHQKPLPVLFVELNDKERSMYYIDPSTARVAQSYGGASRWNRWLYHGLHSMDLPWLYRYRPAWDITVLTLMLGGTALSVTSLVIGWRRVRKKLSPKRRARKREKALAEGLSR